MNQIRPSDRHYTTDLSESVLKRLEKLSQNYLRIKNLRKETKTEIFDLALNEHVSPTKIANALNVTDGMVINLIRRRNRKGGDEHE